MEFLQIAGNLGQATVHIQVYFLGKRQQQREDLKYYHAIGSITVDGYTLTAREQCQFTRIGPGYIDSFDGLKGSVPFQEFLERYSPPKHGPLYALTSRLGP